MATSVRRPFIGSPQRAMVPSDCKEAALAILSVRNARQKIGVGAFRAVHSARTQTDVLARQSLVIPLWPSTLPPGRAEIPPTDSCADAIAVTFCRTNPLRLDASPPARSGS